MMKRAALTLTLLGMAAAMLLSIPAYADTL